MASNRSALPHDLEQLALRAGAAMRTADFRAAMARSAPRAAMVAIAVPLAVVAMQLVRLGFEGDGRLVPWGILAFVTLGLLLLVGLEPALVTRLVPLDTRRALAVLDRRLNLEGRMAAAHAFLAEPERTPFMEAALDDAAERTRAALAGELVMPAPVFPGRLLGALPASVLLIFLSAWLGGFVGDVTEPGNVVGGDVTVANATPSDREGSNITRPDAPPRETTDGESRNANPDQQRGEQREASKDRSGVENDEAKKSSGKSEKGRSAQAQGQSNSSASQGNPSDQTQTPQDEPKTSKPKKNQKPKDPKKEDGKRKRVPPKESGAASSGASSKGSGRNPAVSEWKSRDQVASPNDQEMEQDDDADDEEEDQENRGGVQPNLRDRKPPVNRDLQIGFGNGKNPDANGRGGPSAMKKSRGVAALVLGVPIPDMIKGKPGPGRTKVTQERIEPKAEEAPLADAGGRDRGPATEGRMSQLDLEPWMRDLVRTYFLTLRSEGK
tara:strand:+ start:6002 stop:7492 length:1491 start_codon:yes stop_codon:yes gene_type:complete